MSKQLPRVYYTLAYARELVAQGWCQCAMYKVFEGKQHYCMTGAVMQKDINSSGRLGRVPNEIEREAFMLLADTIAEEHQYTSIMMDSRVIEYNDSFGRTKEEVLNIYDRTIQKIIQKEFA